MPLIEELEKKLEEEVDMDTDISCRIKVQGMEPLDLMGMESMESDSEDMEVSESLEEVLESDTGVSDLEMVLDMDMVRELLSMEEVSDTEESGTERKSGEEFPRRP